MNQPAQRPLIGFGQVRHTRLKPVRHAFAYPGYFWMLPMRALKRQAVEEVKRNRWSWLSFHDADHGLGGADALAWLDGLLRDEGIAGPEIDQGEVWLQTYPRVLGHVFKPVSFWFVHRAGGDLAAVVAEVNNTFGERHAYLLHGQGLAWGREITADKVFHVSPFCDVEGCYRFRFMRTDGGRVVVRIDHDDAQGPVLQTSVSGQLEALTPGSARRAFWGWPLMTLGVVVRIHWQALRVWVKGVPLRAKPAPPHDLVTGPHGQSTP
ncbi:DUF1365 domain-containing protein [Aquabacterium sp.]|uniref:DUF1365 domain-containing protein n=1 Tax=Aquabacterium sp. TaxID=1872578 RepID=UPI003D6C99FD